MSTPGRQCRHGGQPIEPIETLSSEKLTRYWGGILENSWAKALAALAVLLHAAIALPVRPLSASSDDGGWIRHAEDEPRFKEVFAVEKAPSPLKARVHFADFEEFPERGSEKPVQLVADEEPEPSLRKGLRRRSITGRVSPAPKVEVLMPRKQEERPVPLIEPIRPSATVRPASFQDEPAPEALPSLLPASPELDDFEPTTPMPQSESIELAPLAPEPTLVPQPDYIQPVFGDIIGEDSPIYFDDSQTCDTCCSSNEMTGIGRERVMHAPFVVTTSQPFNHYQFGMDLNYNFDRPNRAEYLWAAPPAGPLMGETHVDYQDFTFRIETGNSRFSTSTTLPFRAMDPEIAGNHFGFSNMIITTKTVLLDGRKWQITQLLNTYLNTGSAGKGLGNGHTTLEPGVLVRYEVDPYNYLHGEMKYWFPIGGNKLFEGQVFSSGLAWSHLAVDTDDLALIYTLEGTHSVIETGRFSPPGVGVPRRIDGHNIFTGHIGARLIWDTGGDLGVVEYGLNYGVPLGGHQWSEHRILFNVRFSF